MGRRMRSLSCETGSGVGLARVMGGVVWIAAAALVWLGLPIVGWAVALLIALMVVLDAAFDFCALCFVFLHLDRAGILPARLKSF